MLPFDVIGTEMNRSSNTVYSVQCRFGVCSWRSGQLLVEYNGLTGLRWCLTTLVAVKELRFLSSGVVEGVHLDVEAKVPSKYGEFTASGNGVLAEMPTLPQTDEGLCMDSMVEICLTGVGALQFYREDKVK